MFKRDATLICCPGCATTDPALRNTDIPRSYSAVRHLPVRYFRPKVALRNCVVISCVPFGDSPQRIGGISIALSLSPPTCFGANNGRPDWFPVDRTLWEGVSIVVTLEDTLDALPLRSL